MLLGILTSFSYSYCKHRTFSTCMLQSQIKLPPYDFSHLQFTDEFNNRSGTGRVSIYFRSWSNIVRAPAAYIFDNNGAQSVLFKISQAPWDFTRMKYFYLQWCIRLEHYLPSIDFNVRLFLPPAGRRPTAVEIIRFVVKKTSYVARRWFLT